MSLQVSKIAEANFLVFDAAVANLAVGDPRARCELCYSAEIVAALPSNSVCSLSAWQAS